MVTQNGYDWTFGTALFSISSAADVAKLPTTTAKGRDGEKVFDVVAAGSIAYLTDGSSKKYVLDGAANEWKEMV